MATIAGCACAVALVGSRTDKNQRALCSFNLLPRALHLPFGGQNMALIYIDMGLGRVAPAEAAAVLPDLMVGLGDRPKAQRDGLLVLVTKVWLGNGRCGGVAVLARL